jgi:ABC-type uncharacterized transport system fused permease/ATPase subunit
MPKYLLDYSIIVARFLVPVLIAASFWMYARRWRKWLEDDLNDRWRDR